MNKRAQGKFYEDLAINFLKQKGYKILERNYICSFGEIDIIAHKENILCFIEVKARTKRSFGKPLEAITQLKQKRMVKVAEYYCIKNKVSNKPLRFEVIGIEFTKDETIFEHVENIFI
jgi:putative endonuclease